MSFESFKYCINISCIIIKYSNNFLRRYLAEFSLLWCVCVGFVFQQTKYQNLVQRRTIQVFPKGHKKFSLWIACLHCCLGPFQQFAQCLRRSWRASDMHDCLFAYVGWAPFQVWSRETLFCKEAPSQSACRQCPFSRQQLFKGIPDSGRAESPGWNILNNV